MTTQEKLSAVQEGEILTFTTLEVQDLIDLGWHFDDDDQDHSNFELSFHNGEYVLNAVADSNDTYTVEGTTEGLGGIEGVIELIEKFENTFDQRWVASYGNVELR